MNHHSTKGPSPAISPRASALQANTLAPAAFLGLLAANLLMAHAVSAQQIWYVDASNTKCPGVGSQSNPFCKIQSGIMKAAGRDTVLVLPGLYKEDINFLGKAITVRGAGGPRLTTIDAQSGLVSVVKFVSGEGRNSVLTGFTIRNGQGTVEAPKEVNPHPQNFRCISHVVLDTYIHTCIHTYNMHT